MTELKERVTKMVNELKQERDELRVKVELAKMELGDDWQELERKWSKLESRTRALGQASAESAEDIADAAKKLGAEIRDGFKRIARHL